MATPTMTRTVLIIDDSPTELAIVSDCVRAAGYHVLAVGGGIMAREYVEAHAIDLIILDLILPDISGYSFIRGLHAHNRTSAIPIVVLTSLNSVPQEWYGMQLGVAAYLKKPLCPQDLLTEIRRLVPLA
ncbi:MAG TPA: response regulator [Ktedonobacterales bacterium]|nr:response regulator [Ktedonobacterales bacterium]